MVLFHKRSKLQSGSKLFKTRKTANNLTTIDNIIVNIFNKLLYYHKPGNCIEIWSSCYVPCGEFFSRQQTYFKTRQ